MKTNGNGAKICLVKKLLLFLLLGLVFLLRLQFLPKLDLKEGQKVRVTGVLSEEPQVSGSIQKFKLGQIGVVTQRYPEFGYGDKVEAVGKIMVNSHPEAHPKDPVGDNGITSLNSQSSNPDGILLRQLADQDDTTTRLFIRTTFSLSFPEISLVYPESLGYARDKLRRGTRLDVKGWAIKLRQNLREVYKKVFIPPYDGIVAGVVIGDKSLIPQYFYENLKKTGTLHILVASGMNIALFSSGVLGFFCLFFKRQISVLLLILLIWFYSLITGMQPPIIRAAIMATLLYLGEFIGRQKDGGKILWLTGLMMVFGNPYLVSDVGFQLSFLATAGLVYIQPKIKEFSKSLISIDKTVPTGSNLKFEIFNLKSISNKDEFLKIKILKYLYLIKNLKLKIKNYTRSLLNSENFTSSLSAQIATLPILFMAFGQYNLLSPIVNLLVLWSIPLILQTGAILGILGLFGTIGFGLAKIASYPFILLLLYLEQVINLSAKINVFQVQISKIGAWWVAGYYVILWLWVKNR